MRTSALILVVFVLAGCGGGSSAVSGGGASVVPSTTAAFVAIDMHATADQWHAVAALLQRFPVQDPVLTKLHTLQLGREVDLAAVGSALVVLTRSHEAKIGGFVSKRVGGWTAFARVSSTFDVLGGSATLAKSDAYKRATASLPGTVLARAFAAPGAARRLLTALPAQEQVLSVANGRRRRLPGIRFTVGIATERYFWAAAAVVAGSHRVTLEAHARVAPPSGTLLDQAAYAEVPVTAYPPRIVDEIPADALVVADFRIAPSQFEIVDTTTLSKPLRELLALSPQMPFELDTILGGETAIYVRAGNEVTLVTQPADTLAALEQLKGIEPLLGLPLHVTVFGGELVVSTTQQGLAAFRAGGAKLSADPTFKQATAAAGLPAQTSGFVYADLRSGTSALAYVAELFGLPVPSGRALVLYQTRVGRDAGSILFLQTP